LPRYTDVVSTSAFALAFQVRKSSNKSQTRYVARKPPVSRILDEGQSRTREDAGSDRLPAAGALAYKHDNPNAVVELLNTGHFALETHVEEIASRIDSFLWEAYGTDSP
jgi:hypothetical protein